jgi:hypothetical protein
MSMLRFIDNNKQLKKDENITIILMSLPKSETKLYINYWQTANSWTEMFHIGYLFFNFGNQSWISINAWNACIVYLQIT